MTHAGLPTGVYFPVSSSFLCLIRNVVRASVRSLLGASTKYRRWDGKQNGAAPSRGVSDTHVGETNWPVVRSRVQM